VPSDVLLDDPSVFGMTLSIDWDNQITEDEEDIMHLLSGHS
jgi:hypothetical protein